MADPTFNVVLLHPLIPNNTGNIGRTAAATACRLHLIHPLGFEMSEKARRRAGLDYWNLVDCREHADWDTFLATERPARAWLFTTAAVRPYWSAEYRRGDFLLFGNEVDGAPPAVHEWVSRTQSNGDGRVVLPMVADSRARSLNLATAVCAAVYEGLRQTLGANAPFVR